MVITLPVRANHAGVRMRVSLVLQRTALGGLLPVRYRGPRRRQPHDQGGDVVGAQRHPRSDAFFILVELIEVWEDGVGYFIIMWNLMDWVCFVFFLVYYWYQQLDVYLNDASCGDGAIVCEAIGFHDDWRVMGTTKTIKQHIAICASSSCSKLSSTSTSSFRRWR